MYTTQVCPYCVRAKALLKQRGVEQIDEIRIDLDPAQRDHMMADHRPPHRAADLHRRHPCRRLRRPDRAGPAGGCCRCSTAPERGAPGGRAACHARRTRPRGRAIIAGCGPAPWRGGLFTQRDHPTMADEANPVFQIQRMYLKDLSLEQPNSPQILLEQQQPQVDINLGLAAEPVPTASTRSPSPPP
jgi:hypothetical protein